MPKFFSQPAGTFVADDPDLHFWPVQEGLGGAFTDQRYPRVDFTSSNVTWGAPKFNGWGGAIFNGSNAYASAGDAMDVGTNNINFAIWVYVSIHDTYNTLINKLGDWNIPDYTVGYRIELNDSQWVVRLQTGATSDYSLTIANTHNIPTGTWTHIAFTIDRSANRVIRYYLNGTLYNTGSIPNVSPGASLSNGFTHYMGRSLYIGTVRYFTGSLAQCFLKMGPIWTDGDVWRIYKNAR